MQLLSQPLPNDLRSNCNAGTAACLPANSSQWPRGQSGASAGSSPRGGQSGGTSAGLPSSTITRPRNPSPATVVPARNHGSADCHAWPESSMILARTTFWQMTAPQWQQIEHRGRDPGALSQGLPGCGYDDVAVPSRARPGSHDDFDVPAKGIQKPDQPVRREAGQATTQ